MAGCTTFLAVHPIVNRVFSATPGWISGVFVATVLPQRSVPDYGVMANYPIALAPGWVKTLFAYTIVSMGHSWQTALATVLYPVVIHSDQPALDKELIINSIPKNLKHAITQE